MQVNIDELQHRVDQGLIRVARCGDVMIWCYTEKCQYSQAWDEYTLMARGLVTTMDGTVIARPFPKFFNLEEHRWYSPKPITYLGVEFYHPRQSRLPWNEPLEITAKIDGSLVVMTARDESEDGVHVSNKCTGNNHVVDFARQWLGEHPAVAAHIREHPGFTYLWEAVFPKGRIIVDYQGIERLYLISIIINKDGGEFDHSFVEHIAEGMCVPTTPAVTVTRINDFIQACKQMSVQDGEGFVIRFTWSNIRVKVKSTEYVRISRLIDTITDKQIFHAMRTGTDLETLYSVVPDEAYTEFREIYERINDERWKVYNDAIICYTEAKTKPCRKAMAETVAAYPVKDVKGAVFRMLDGKPADNEIWNTVQKRLFAR